MFMDDALNSYTGNIVELPVDLDLERPMSWQSFAQKRSKTGNFTDQPFFAEPRIPELYKSVPQHIQRPAQRYEFNLLNISSFTKQENTDYNPAKDFPSYMKNSPHLNDLSRNLRSKHMNDYPVGLNQNIEKNEVSNQLNIKPLRAPPSRVGQISLPPLNESQLDLKSNVIKSEFGVHNRSKLPHYTSHQVTGSNEEKKEVPLNPNEHKQPVSWVYQNTRSSMKIKMETVQVNEGSKQEISGKQGEETLDSQIKRYEAMLKAAEELKKLIDHRIKKDN